MRNGRVLAEDTPDRLMLINKQPVNMFTIFISNPKIL